MQRFAYLVAGVTALALCLSVGAPAKPAATATLKVDVIGNGFVYGDGISCGFGNTNCSDSYTVGSQVVLNAVAANGVTFLGWAQTQPAAAGLCAPAAGNPPPAKCTVTVDQAKTVSATFGSSDRTLTVTASGQGIVTAPGISCGLGNTDCSETYNSTTNVELTATPAAGFVFQGWAQTSPQIVGFCGSGTGQPPPTKCTVTMDQSKSVVASFAPAGGATATLTVHRPLYGLVTGPNIACGVDLDIAYADCSETYATGSVIRLTAKPTANARFLGWGGACSGSQLTCLVTMNGPQTVSASFALGPFEPPAPQGFVLEKIGSPVVFNTGAGWQVHLSFFTSRAGGALMRVSRNGATVQAFTFAPRAGDVRVGPFFFQVSGQYTFQLDLTAVTGEQRSLTWSMCLSNNGCSGIFRPTFVTRGTATATRTASGWLVRVNFRAGTAGVAQARLTRAGRLVSSGTFTFRRGPVNVTLGARQAGLHTVVVTAHGSNGRRVSMTWHVVLR